MTNDQDAMGFEPVLLNLADSDDYATVVNALQEYADAQDWKAEEERESSQHNNLPQSESEEEYWRKSAARARRIADDIERQLDANNDARRAVDGTGE